MHLYLAGWGIIIALGTAVFVLVGLHNPSLLEGGRWMSGPWYARMFVQLAAFWFAAGGLGFGFYFAADQIRKYFEPID